MRRLWLAAVALICLGSGWSLADYAATQGSGTTFGSVVVGGVHYVQNFLCDLTVPARCATVTAAGAVTVGGAVNVTPTPCSGTITTGGTAQNAFAASAVRRAFMIQNKSTETLYLEFSGTATTGSYELAAASTGVPGGSFSSQFGLGTSLALSVLGPTTGNAFKCDWW